MAPRKGLGEHDHKGARSPKMVHTYLEITHLQKIKKMPVFIIFKGSFTIFFLGCIPFSLTIVSGKIVEQIRCCSAHLIQTDDTNTNATEHLRALQAKRAEKFCAHTL